jgi:LysR family cyn operon transcriptional activator
MDLRQLRYFLAVANTQHMTRAAEQLHVTQSTLSHQIGQMEQALATQLFDRVGRGIRLTEAGELFRGFAQRALAELESGVTALAELDHVLRGQLRVGVIHTINSSLVPPVISRFVAEHAGVRVTVDEMSGIDIEEGLVRGQLDLGIGFAPASSVDITAERLFDEKIVLIAPRSVVGSGRRTMRAAKLAGVKLALMSPRFMTRRLIDAAYGQYIAGNVMLEMNSIEALLATVRCGGVSTILNERALPHEEDLIKGAITDPGTVRTAALLWHRERYRSAAARRFAEMFTLGIRAWNK